MPTKSRAKSRDPLTPAERSRQMARVRSQGAGPELVVRRLCHQLGYRYRLHRRDLPGKPDLVFPGRRCIIFVHGCWWHGHLCKRGDRPASNNHEYWQAKVARNRARDAGVLGKLKVLGWRVLVVWECQTRDRERLAETLADFLGPTRPVSPSRLSS